nr:MAG TPA: hypothetical protein [Caudoviricetes sp.]
MRRQRLRPQETRADATLLTIAASVVAGKPEGHTSGFFILLPVLCRVSLTSPHSRYGYDHSRTPSLSCELRSSASACRLCCCCHSLFR